MSKFLQLLVIYISSLLYGYIFSYLVNISISPPIYFLMLVPLIYLLVTTRSRTRFFILYWGCFAGIFFSGFEGLIDSGQSWFGLSLGQSLISHFVVSHIMTFLAAVFVSLWFEIKVYFKFSLAQSLVSLPLCIYLSEIILPSLFPLSFAVSLGLTSFEYKQLMSVFGLEGLSLLLIWINSLLVYISVNLYKQSFKMAFNGCITLLTVLIGLQLLAIFEKSRWQETDSQVKFAYFQPGYIDEHDNLSPDKMYEGEKIFLSNFKTQAEKVIKENPGLDFLMLPETQIFSSINRFDHNSTDIKQMVSDFGVPLFSGGHVMKVTDRSNYNALFTLDKYGKMTNSYHKVHLMPVGEYRPFSKSLPMISKYMPGLELYSFGASAGFSSQEIGGVRYSFSICYEDILRPIHRTSGNKGSDIFLSVSSDYRFGKKYFAKNHASMVASRALEERKPVIRDTNTGISFVMKADGTVIDQAPLLQAYHKVVELKFKKNPPTTFFHDFEFSWPFVHTIFSLFLVILLRRRESIGVSL